ncbi:MAG: tetratricopeptide repeat protein [Prolixibacteraceae bacterium]|nr:tetratricopeptide repeat protein [Prolixibacteraceae bacterium]
MKEKDIQIKYNNICDCLADRKLKPAFDMIDDLIEEYNIKQFSDECRTLEETYHFMLKYTVEGINDPERKKVYRHLIISVFELADQLNETLLQQYSTSIIYQKKRGFHNFFIKNYTEFVTEIRDYYAGKELQELVIETISDKTLDDKGKEHLENIRILFFHIWFLDKYGEDDAEFISELLKDISLEHSYKALIISSLTLSLLRYFDKTKFNLLFDAFESQDAEVKQRAFVGLLICIFKYDKRMQFLPSLAGRLVILFENQGFKKNLERILLQFIRTKETEKIQQKIRDEIIPEMIRISPNLKDKINLDSLMEEGLTDDKNPEWEKIFEDSPGLIDKMQEFSELQMEGADVFLGSFSMLKSFPFFSEISNWFIPFFIENPEISNEINTNDPVNLTFIKTLSFAPVLCNSDKYSFCFSLKNLPEENREMLVQGMKAEMDQFSEIEKDEEITSPGRKDEFISNQYIQDLYRFYKLHPGKSGFEDIFSWRFDFYNTKSVGSLLTESPELLRNIAEFYFTKNHFEEASEVYSILLNAERNGELYQKRAFCYQKLGDYSNALSGYLKTELYELNKLWNIKKIALCYRNLKQPDKALEYYRQAEKLDAENLGIQLSIGHCLLELNQYEEALKCYFKVEYLAPGNKKVWRPIGWCSFLTGKNEQAEKYFLKLINDNPTKHDFMNMGHVQWSLGKRKEALDFYKKSIKKGGFSNAEFQSIFEDDLHHLIKAGINPEDVPIMLDQLRYSLED